MRPRDAIIYYSDDMIGAERVNGFSSFSKVHGNIFLGREPSYLDIKQTVIGDCYFLSALKSIVRRNPKLIHDIIKEKKGRIHVRLYYPAEIKGSLSEQWYVIDKSIVTHLINKLGLGHEAPWVYLLEKAYALHRLRDPKFLVEKQKHNKKVKIESTQNLDFYDILSTGNSDFVFMDLLGCQAFWSKIPHPNSSLILLLKSNPETLFHSKNIQNKEIISRLFKNNESLFLYYSSLLMNLSFNKTAYELFKHDAFSLTDKIQMGNATQNEILKFFKSHFIKMNKEFYNAIKIAVYQGIETKLGDKKYSIEAIETYHKIHMKIKNGELVTISTNAKFLENQNSIGLIPGHSYEVLNCYQREGHCYIVISNPWQRLSRRYDVDENSHQLIPKVHDTGFFHNANVNYNQFRHVHDIAIDNDAYHPNKTLNQSGTFELELNDCMNFFHLISFTKIENTIKKYRQIYNALNDEVDFYQQEINRISQSDSKKEINEAAPKHIANISLMRTEQDRIMKLITDLTQLQEKVDFNPELNIPSIKNA